MAAYMVVKMLLTQECFMASGACIWFVLCHSLSMPFSGVAGWNKLILCYVLELFSRYWHLAKVNLVLYPNEKCFESELASVSLF